MLSENLSPNTLRPIFSNALSLKLETIKLDAFIQNFSAGQTLPGKVVQVLPDQKAVVEFRGEKVLLQFQRPVSPGQAITVKVEQVHPNPILKLTEPVPAIASPKTAPAEAPKTAGIPNPPAPAGDKTTLHNRVTVLPQTGQGTPQKLEAGTVKPSTSQETPRGALPVSDTKVIEPVTREDLQRLGIQAGHKVKAEVVRVVNPQTVQVRFQGQEITVKHSADVQLGKPVTLYARPVGADQFILELEPAPPVPPAATRPTPGLTVLKNYLPVRQPLVQVLSGLKEIFLDGPATAFKALNLEPIHLEQLQANLRKLVFQEPQPLNAPQVKEVVDRTGLHYEAKVKDFVDNPDPARRTDLLKNDLKGQLMRLVRQLEQMPVTARETSASDPLIGKLLTQLNQAVSNIELQQLTHHFAREEHHPLLLQLPQHLLGEEERLKIYILPDSGEGSGDSTDLHNRPFNLVFLLHLSALGELRIEARVHQNDISIHIIGTNAEAVRFIQEHVPELKASLHEQGFSLSVTSRHQAEVPMEVPDSLDQLLINHQMQLVDVKT
ncbi:MAG: flagellar hook-length control protein FliK [Nitrospinae bacterium]|nr:flagellar hook-length control protein FliK [Nitrospinota bacterium]